MPLKTNIWTSKIEPEVIASPSSQGSAAKMAVGEIQALGLSAGSFSNQVLHCPRLGLCA